LKILLLHTKYQLQGGEDAVVEQELELLKQHHTVEVIYFQNQGGWKGALQFLGSLWNVCAAKTVQQKIQKFQPDVVHVHNWHFAMGPLAFREINRFGIPIVHTVHNFRLLCPSAILLHKGSLFTNSLKESFPWTAVRNKIDSYVCLTPFAVALFQKSNFGIPKGQFTVKPNFTIAPEVLKSIAREEHFLFIGRLSEEKGIAVLLNAFKDLPFLLKIAGEGPLKDLVLNSTKQSSNIIYLGSLTNEKVTEELQKTQALIFPSVWYEGMPMTILEAFSTATPVIASNLGAMTSLISNGSNGFHFAPGNVNHLKEIVIKFNALSIAEKKEKGSNAFENYQSTYSPELQQDYFDAIYNKVKKYK
jgi:glycosyltransferase involved in cell wall biosynthesis